MISNIRFLDNLLVEVYQDGDTKEMKIPFGRWYIADKVVDTNDGFYDVYLSNRHGGGVIYGLSKDVVELHGIEPVLQD